MHLLSRHVVVLSFLWATSLFGQDGIVKFPVREPVSAAAPDLWTKDSLFANPSIIDSADFPAEEGIQPIYFEGVPYQGKPTKVFAWIGVPNAPHSGKLPGVVLVHGGGGTAFRDWVKLWMDRGYVAIAIDHCGTIPTKTEGFGIERKRHAYSGGSSFAEGGFADIGQPLEDQWFYHAVASIARAHTILATVPEVDPKRIGLIGISWGGVLSLITAGVDPRYAFVVSVYGCGYLGESSSWLQTSMQITPPDLMAKWVAQWDPAQYGKATRMPVLLCNGTNDFHFRPDAWSKTAAGIDFPVTRAFKTLLPHGHPPEGDPSEITIYADSIVRVGNPLPKITSQGQNGDNVWASYEASVPIKEASLVFTTDSGDWTQRKWSSRPAQLDTIGRRVSALRPQGVTAYYLNIQDNRGCIVSSVLSMQDPVAP